MSPGVNWTSKQSVSLAGAILIQVAAFLLLSEPPLVLPGIAEGGTASRRLLVRLAAEPEPAPPLAVTHPAMTDQQQAQAAVALMPVTLDAEPTGYALRLSDRSLHQSGGYLPVSQLTEKPLVLNDIDPELSGRFAFIHPQSLTLILLINEYGDVDRVLLSERKAMAESSEEKTLPVVLLDELIQRFSETRFLPGRLHGQAVRSALTIRVSLAP